MVTCSTDLFSGRVVFSGDSKNYYLSSSPSNLTATFVNTGRWDSQMREQIYGHFVQRDMNLRGRFPRNLEFEIKLKPDLPMQFT